MRSRLPLVVAALAATALLGCASAAAADGYAAGRVQNSPGILSGNLVQAPVHVPVNACGNAVTVIGALNPTFGNVCGNF
ncbi:chaplin [Streptomyces sp. NPDC007205]|uniref:chaplin n=1 Tax=Streptomyces sp. NPDC007205 TaxID=3154316 RepID=UPI0033F0F723